MAFPQKNGAKALRVGTIFYVMLLQRPSSPPGQSRVTQIRIQIEEATSDYEREKLQNRVVLTLLSLHVVRRLPETADAHGATICAELA